MSQSSALTQLAAPDFKSERSHLIERLVASDLLSIGTGRLEFKVSTNLEIEKFSEAVRELISCLESDIQESVFSILEHIVSQQSDLRPFARYFLDSLVCSSEAREAGFFCGYQSTGLSKEFISDLCPFDIGNSTVVDFGFGNLETLFPWQALGAKVIGLDQSPFFVDRARRAGFESYLVQIDSSTGARSLSSRVDIATSTLTLDRVAKPIQLIRNMSHSLRNGGVFAIQTLLPVIPVDDGPTVSDPIIYTMPEHQVSKSTNQDENLGDIIRTIEANKIRKIRVKATECRVGSLDGFQTYSIISVSGFKSE